MDGFAETHFLERGSGGVPRADGTDRQSARDGSGGRQEMAAAERDTVCAEKSADLIDHGSKLLAKLESSVTRQKLVPWWSMLQDKRSDTKMFSVMPGA
jgi:hypothetical protein